MLYMLYIYLAIFIIFACRSATTTLLSAQCLELYVVYTHILQVFMLSILIWNVLENCRPSSLSFLFFYHTFYASSDNDDNDDDDDDCDDFEECVALVAVGIPDIIFIVASDWKINGKVNSTYHSASSKWSNVMNFLFEALHSREFHPKHKSFGVQ